jgi:choline dehydrogenase-like flavoprotein
MQIDADTLAVGPDDTADILIVGAGAVGLVLAAELVRAGRNVVVLEAGPATLQPESQELFENATWDGYPLEGLHVGRFRVLGGTTNFWGGQVMPPQPMVFEPRDWVSHARWPITAADIEPHYDRLFELLGMAREIRDDSVVWKRVSHVPPAPADGLEIVLSRWLPETNLARVFRADISSNPKLRLYVNAPVTALMTEEDGSTISGARVGAKGHAFRAKRVVLANGTVEIVRLLKLVLADGRTAPWQNNPWLGKCFMDHVDCLAGSVHMLDAKRFHDRFDNIFLDGIKYCPKFQLTEAAARTDQSVGMLGVVLFNSSFQEHLVNFKIFAKSLLRGKFDGSWFAYPGQILGIFKIAVPMIARYLRYRRMYNPSDQGIQLRLSAEQVPLPRSEIQLTAKIDALGMPIPHVHWDIDGAELRTMSSFAKKIRDYLKRQGLANVTLDPLLEQADPAFMKTIDDGNHQMGGARMAGTSEDGVVDSTSAVFGAKNLYVAGAVTFPTTGAQNPTFMAMALALRLAKHLQQSEA